MISYWNTPLRIGALIVPRFIGGPLDGLTDEPFRHVTRLFCSRSLLYTEIRHVAAIANMPIKRISVDQATRPINFQITAHNTDYIDEACARIRDMGVDLVDLNVGCPARHIVNAGAGSALMADIPRLAMILSRLRAALNVPLTVKMRAGFKEYNAHTVARVCQSEGVDAIVVHPRLQTEHFRGAPNYAILGAIKAALSIPVIVSGGIKTFYDARVLYEQTGIDGFLIGRAQMGAPWLLRQLNEESCDNSFVPDKTLVQQAIVKHLMYLEAYYGTRGISLARRHIGWYTRCRSNARTIRKYAQESQSWQQLHTLMRTME